MDFQKSLLEDCNIDNLLRLAKSIDCTDIEKHKEFSFKEMKEVEETDIEFKDRIIDSILSAIAIDKLRDSLIK